MMISIIIIIMMMMMTGQIACSSPATVKPASVIAVRNLLGIVVIVGIILIVILVIVIIIIVIMVEAIFIIVVIVGDLVVFELILVTRSGLSKSMSKTLPEHLSIIEAHIGN